MRLEGNNNGFVAGMTNKDWQAIDGFGETTSPTTTSRRCSHFAIGGGGCPIDECRPDSQWLRNDRRGGDNQRESLSWRVGETVVKRLIVMLLGFLVVGCSEQGDGVVTQFDAAAAKAALAEGQVPAQADPAAAKEEPKLVPITKREARLVDKQKAMQENPKLIEVENKINASDPLTAVAQGYFAAASQAQVLTMQHNINIQREIDDRWPTFAEFEEMVKQYNIKLQGLYAYQMYAYDETTGGLSILEDRAEKKSQYEAAGRDYPHAE